MDRVVSYDYPIDNNEEMKMENTIVEDINGNDAEVGLITNLDGTVKSAIALDFDPYDYNHHEGMCLMRYTPNQARKLAAALILAAEEAEKR